MEHEASTARSDLEQMLVDETIEPKALPLSLLKAITDDFSNDREIGRGGFAKVYKGVLGNRSVAVKKLSRAYMHETEFDREIECLTRAKHKNVVRFLGYCDDRQRSAETYDGKLIMADVQQRLLCFEYIHNGSLDLYIKDAHRDWDTCYKIIKGICHGLQYLHDNRIIHLDLKPANILLDNDMVPKITDFGLSRCLDENQSQVLTRNILGTTGYLAPERFEGSGIARSGDLYSLGIIIMEILTGQKGHQTSEDVLESWSGRLERSQQDTLYEQIRVCYEIALNCIQFNPKDRPASAQDMIDRLHKMESIQGWFGEMLNFSPDPAQLPDPPANLSPGGAATKKASKDDMLEQMSHLCVSVVKARDLPTMNSTGSLDPYVEVQLGDLKGMTRQLKKNANPVWRQMFTFSAAHLQSNQLQIIVKHKDVLRDDFVGRVFFDMSDIPSRLVPDSQLAPQWYHLSDTQGENSHSLGEIMLAVWLGTQADKSYMEAWHSDAHALSMGRIANTRSKVYYTPKLICLKVSVLAAQDLKGTEEDQPLGPTIAKIEMGSQIKLTRTGQPQGSANPAWNEELMFVVSEPFGNENPLVVTVVEKVGAGREEPIGRVIIPVSSPYELRNDLAMSSVPFEWFSLSSGMTGSKIQLRINLDTSSHVMAEWTDYMSDLHPPPAF